MYTRQRLFNTSYTRRNALEKVPSHRYYINLLFFSYKMDQHSSITVVHDCIFKDINMKESNQLSTWLVFFNSIG